MGQLFRYQSAMTPEAVEDFFKLVVEGARKLATADIRELADLLHEIARDRHDLGHALHIADVGPSTATPNAV